MLRTSTRLMLALCGLPLWPAGAQVTLDGQVVDFTSGAPIPDARVEVRTTTGRVYHRTATDGDGRFRAAVAPGGAYTIRASRVDYGATETPVLDLRTLRVSAGDTVRIEVAMSEHTFVLAPLTVTAVPRSRNVYMDAFEGRRSRGTGGHFITRAEIERRAPFFVSDLLQEIPGVRVTPGRTATGRQITMSRTVTAGCLVQVFVDGILANRPFKGLEEGESDRDADGWSLDEIISPEQVEAIEVFQGAASVPAEFRNQDSRCGVIAIWTRSGAGMRRARG